MVKRKMVFEELFCPFCGKMMHGDVGHPDSIGGLDADNWVCIDCPKAGGETVVITYDEIDGLLSNELESM